MAGRDVIDYGNDYYTPYDGPNYINSSGYNISFPYNNQPSAYSPTTIVNPNLEPSFSTAFETGIDMKFFNNRLALDLTTSMLLTARTCSTCHFLSPLVTAQP